MPPQLRDGQYRVINAAIPGYASGNELAKLALQILPYNPDEEGNQVLAERFDRTIADLQKLQVTPPKPPK